MKKLIFILFFISLIFQGHGQSMGYADLALQFSQEHLEGTARFNAMSGAFGALGGDVSSTYTNPAGGAVFSKTEIAWSLTRTGRESNTTYYNSHTKNSNINFRSPQFGAVFVFKNPNYNAKWYKYAFGFNYNTTNNYKNHYKAQGNNNTYARYTVHPFDSEDPKIPYNTPLNQSFENITSGNARVYSFSFSAAHKKAWYLGGAVNSHHFSLTQDAILREINGDTNNNELHAKNTQYLSQLGDGLSLSIGVISKPTNNIRLGFSFNSPVWYYNIEEFSNYIDYDTENEYDERGYLSIYSNDIDGVYENSTSNFPEQLYFKYKLNTPLKLTGSFAYTFNKNGLISIDYTLKDYQSLQLTPSYEFIGDNSFISNTYAISNSIRTGTEWIIKQFSLRGGYSFEQSPFKNAAKNEHIHGYSLGLGYKIKNAKIDISYNNTNHTEYYNFYNHPQENVSSTQIDKTTSKITATLSFIL